MMKDSLNKKTYIGDIEPNPKEFGIWVKQDGTAKVYDYINNEWKGGSSDNGGESSSIEYLDLRNQEYDVVDPIAKCSQYIKCYFDYGECFVVPGMIIDDFSYAVKVGVAIDFNMSVTLGQSNGKFTMTLKEYFVKYHNLSNDVIDAIPRLTKEQFYSLEP